MNTYVVGVQRWLGVDLPLPTRIDSAKVERIRQWLSERNPAKEAMAALFLTQLVNDLFNYVSFAKLAGDGMPDVGEYPDFTPWYVRADGARYAVEHKVAPANGHRFWWKNEGLCGFVEELTQTVRH